MKELIYALLVPAVVFYTGITIWACIALSDWSPTAEYMAYEDVRQCIEYAAPGEYEAECEYMMEDHRKVADQNPQSRRITKEEWDEYWAVYARSLERDGKTGQRH